jgi:hypothetical protein
MVAFTDPDSFLFSRKPSSQIECSKKHRKYNISRRKRSPLYTFRPERDKSRTRLAGLKSPKTDQRKGFRAAEENYEKRLTVQPDRTL